MARAADQVDATRAALRQAMRLSAGQEKAPLFSRETMLSKPIVSEVQLSPDGRFLSFRQRREQQTDLLLEEIASGRQILVRADIQRLKTAWSGDGRRLWLADSDGLAVFESDSGAARRILKWDGKRQQRFWAVDANAPGYAIISEKIVQDGAWRFRYLLVNGAGQTRLLHEAGLALRDVLLSGDGQLAYAAGYEGAQYDTVIRRYGAANGRELMRCRGIEQCRLIGHSQARETLWLLSHNGEDTLALQRWRNGRRQTLHSDPAGIADASDLLWQSGAGDWLAIAYHPDHRQWHGNGAQNKTRLAALRRHLPDSNLHLSASADGKLWLVRARRSDWPEDRYYLYLPHGDVLRPLFGRQTSVVQIPAPEQLAPAQPVRYRARDGMLLHGYLYLPRGVAPAQAPLIAMIHGGPYNRDNDNYNPIVQLLANRGYAVFTPNFRASTGYGLRYLRAAQGDFGKGRVLTDILDGLDFLLAQGVGDPGKQAVIGHSFGGYASLLALSHYPQRFRFAFAGAAPVDFSWSMRWIADNGGSALPEDGPPAEVFFAQHGVPLADASWRRKMERESPLMQVPGQRTPVYLWAGARDDRIPLKSIVHYAAEAGRQGARPSLLIDPEAGHNPESALSMEALVYQIESAAAQHFGGVATPPSPELLTFLNKNLRLRANRAD